MACAAGLHLGPKGFHRHARTDLGLERRAPFCGVNDPSDLDAVHLRAYSSPAKGQLVHQKSRIDTDTQRSFADAPGYVINLGGLFGARLSPL